MNTPREDLLLGVPAGTRNEVPNGNGSYGNGTGVALRRVAPDQRTGAELVKINSHGLRGSIAEELDNNAPQFSKDASTVLKFHGIYSQQDRDARKAGLAPVHGSMVRVQVPGGVLTPGQYLALDRLADEAGDGTLRITTRQDAQFHRVQKPDLRHLQRTLNESLLGSFTACGDVVRNVTCCPAPSHGGVHDELQVHARNLSDRLKPKTRAYYQIWMDGEKVAAEEVDEPVYGPAYLPRKFKIGFTAPGENCIDVYTNDVGIVPLVDGGRVRAFTILVGGGMGSSPGVKLSYPRLASPLATVSPDRLEETAEALVTIHRDYGNRTNRKLARLKYVLDDWGLTRFKEELDARVGCTLPPPEPLAWNGAGDHLGWHPQGDGFWYLGVAVASGRVRDLDGARTRTGLRELVERFGSGVRFTPQQNVMLTGIRPEDRGAIERTLARFGIPMAPQLLPMLRNALACPALPTCGLAITEAERALPGVVDDILKTLCEMELEGEAISVRMTGCPNGCARPHTAEIGLVGESVNMYGIYLGASPVGTRMGFHWASTVPRAEIAQRLRPVFAMFRERRAAGEAFGDFCHRVQAELP